MSFSFDVQVYIWLESVIREGTVRYLLGGGGGGGLGLQRGGPSMKFRGNGGGSRLLNL